MRAVILVGVAVGCVVAIAAIAIAITLKDIRVRRSMSRRAIGTVCVAGLVMAATIAYAVTTPASS